MPLGVGLPALLCAGIAPNPIPNYPDLPSTTTKPPGTRVVLGVFRVISKFFRGTQLVEFLRAFPTAAPYYLQLLPCEGENAVFAPSRPRRACERVKACAGFPFIATPPSPQRSRALVLITTWTQAPLAWIVFPSLPRARSSEARSRLHSNFQSAARPSESDH